MFEKKILSLPRNRLEVVKTTNLARGKKLFDLASRFIANGTHAIRKKNSFLQSRRGVLNRFHVERVVHETLCAVAIA